VYHGITNRNRSAFVKAVRPTGSGPLVSIMALQKKARVSVQAAKECGVPWSTLKVHISRNVGNGDVEEGGPFDVPTLGCPFVLPKLVELRQRKTGPFWWWSFRQRYGLSLRTPEKLAASRAVRANKESIEDFYDKLEQTVASFSCNRSQKEFLTVTRQESLLWNISPARPVLLLLDSHASHVGIGVIDFARENDIHSMTFPSHCSHSLQPLDLSIYKSLKNAWANELDRYKHNNPVGAPTRFDFGKLFSVPYAIAFSAEKIRNGLRKAGIYPMNRNAVQPEAIAPSRLTAGDGDFSQTRTATLPSDSANGIVWNVLCLPKCTDGNAGKRRRNVDPKARMLTPLSEKRLRGRAKKTETANAAPSTEPSSSSSEENERLAKCVMARIQEMLQLVMGHSGFSAYFAQDDIMNYVLMLMIRPSSCALNATNPWNSQMTTVIST
ncbi:hypothetical protein ANN_25287, partial [Periplaneta americana]